MNLHSAEPPAARRRNRPRPRPRWIVLLEFCGLFSYGAATMCKNSKADFFNCVTFTTFSDEFIAGLGKFSLNVATVNSGNRPEN